MDFFEAQARAKRRTGPLVALFCLAVAGTITALYFAFVGGTALLGLRANSHGGGLEAYPEVGLLAQGPIDWWQPGALIAVSLLVIPTVLFSALYKWSQLRAGGPAVAADVGGRPVSPDTKDSRERTLLNIVEEMSIASGLPAPAVFILPAEPAINAFAAGYTRSDAAVAVTRGTLERLDRDELQGVVAHEFSHILNGDMRLNTRLVSLLYGILSLVIIGRGFFRASFDLARSSGNSNKNGVGVAIPVMLAGLVLVVIGGLGLLFARLLQSAVSRQREYLADAAAVQFTRNPAGLSGALKKVGAHAFHGRLAHPAAGEVSHFCFAQNFRSSFGGLFATHPSLETRIRLLDPAFDGRYPDLPPLPGKPSPAATRPSKRPRLTPAALFATAGILEMDTVSAARGFLDRLPPALRDAARDPAGAAALACAVCLPPDAAGPARDTALALLAPIPGAPDPALVENLHALLATLPASAALPLLQTAAPALRQLPPEAHDALLQSLDELVHADGTVCPREFALQKTIARDLRLADRPREALRAVSPSAASPHLSLALSAAARLDAPDDDTARALFARAAMGFNGIHPPLDYVPAESATLAHLDRALDQLALTPAPFRKRALAALAAALTADDHLSPAEADLLRALAAALDCPLPPAPTDLA
jgi:Zn-dependent protease with chaperone function/uncharacterized tellurite resistance protein B-like protein